MSREKQIDEMARIIDDNHGFIVSSVETAKALYNASYRKQEWISVEDRLPDEDGEYLTWDGLIYFLIWFNASLGLWNVTEGSDTSTAIKNVTHWMPLPEAPKMKGGDKE